jgi:hypothetical protein
MLKTVRSRLYALTSRRIVFFYYPYPDSSENVVLLPDGRPYRVAKPRGIEAEIPVRYLLRISGDMLRISRDIQGDFEIPPLDFNSQAEGDIV